MFEDAINEAQLYEFIAQNNAGEFPEGFDVIDHVKQTVKDIRHESVLDFGCGAGRLSPSFCPNKYIGVDHNHKMFETAKKRFQEKSFQVVESQDNLRADLFFSYMTLCHLDDKKLGHVMDRLHANYIVVMEVMGRRWRYQKCIAEYTRDCSEYLALFRSHDYILQKKEQRSFARYKNSPSYQHLDTNLTTLIFKRHNHKD